MLWNFVLEYSVKIGEQRIAETYAKSVITWNTVRLRNGFRIDHRTTFNDFRSIGSADIVTGAVVIAVIDIVNTTMIAVVAAAATTAIVVRLVETTAVVIGRIVFIDGSVDET